MKKLLVNSKNIETTSHFVCDWCGESEGIAFVGDKIELSFYPRSFKDVGWGYLREGAGLFGNPGKYDNYFVEDFKLVKETQVCNPTICQNCVKQLARVKDAS